MIRLNSTSRIRSISFVVALVLGIIPSCFAQTVPPLALDLRNKIDDIAHHVLQTTGVPSASLAIVRDGKIAYAQAYGDARTRSAYARAAADALQHRLN